MLIMKIYIKLFAILLSAVGLVSSDEDTQRVITVETVQYPVLRKMVKIRCTRRFSPGVCVDNVAPVWTFVFLQQNCTERLGCPNNYRTNRFRSYKMCMKRCRGLMDMYLKMVEFEDKVAETNVTLDDEEHETDNEDRNLREGFAKHLSASTKFVEDLEDQDDEEEEYKGSEQDTRFVVYKDRSMNEDIMPEDVDYVPGEIRSELLMQW